MLKGIIIYHKFDVIQLIYQISKWKHIFYIRIKFIYQINPYRQVHYTLHYRCPINFIEKRYLDKLDNEFIIRI